MEVPLADQIVMPGSPTFEAYGPNTRLEMMEMGRRISTAAESESAAVRIEGHPRTRPRARESPARCPTPREGSGSRYRWDLKRREKTRESQQHARERGPQTNKQQRCSARGYQVRDGQRLE